MQQCTNGSLVWFTFDLFADIPRLVHGVFSRHGGVSSGEFDSLNFGSMQGDLAENIAINRKRAVEALEIDLCCGLWQHHGTTVVKANPNQTEHGDVLTTNQAGIGLRVLHADCQAAIFYDPIHQAVSNVHCGWRGNVQNVYKATVEAMQSLYGSKPEDLLVGISASLGPMASEFINFKTELPETFYPFQFKPTYFNLWEISRWQLLNCGILDHHIEIDQTCTYSNPTDFFSYRRVKASGRNATIVSLKK